MFVHEVRPHMGALIDVERRLDGGQEVVEHLLRRLGRIELRVEAHRHQPDPSVRAGIDIDHGLPMRVKRRLLVWPHGRLESDSGHDPALREVAAAARNAQEFPHRAVGPVGPDDPPGTNLLLKRAAVDGAEHVVWTNVERNDFRSPANGAAGGFERLSHHTFDVCL